MDGGTGILRYQWTLTVRLLVEFPDDGNNRACLIHNRYLIFPRYCLCLLNGDIKVYVRKVGFVQHTQTALICICYNTEHVFM